MSDIKILEQRAIEIRKRYDKLAKDNNREPWDVQKLARGFKKDVNELIEILNKAPMDQRNLEHELADCLWSVFVISRRMNIDIERAFWATMGELDHRLDGEIK